MRALSEDAGVVLPTPLRALDDPRLVRRDVRLLIKEDHRSHARFGGNKWRKLAGNLEAARRRGDRTLLTFGLPTSNHLQATAAAGRAFGFATAGVVCDDGDRRSTPVLESVRADGMRLCWTSRPAYDAAAPAADLDALDPGALSAAGIDLDATTVLPEGGTNPAAVRGARAIVDEIDEPFDLIACPLGTGGTFAGIVTGLAGRARALGMAVLNPRYDAGRIRRHLLEATGTDPGGWTVDRGCAVDPRAPLPAEIAAFARDFHDRHGVELDARYNAKALAGLFALLERGEVPSGSTVVYVHTGGLFNETWRIGGPR